MRMRLLRGLAIAGLAIAALLVPATASAAPPTNDDFASATLIAPSALPFSDSVVIDDATLESGEPGCYLTGKSVWYSITPTASGVLRADIGSSTFFDRFVWVYRQDGSGFGGLTTIACASPYYNGQSAATFTVEAGKTYYLQAGGVFSYSTGTLNLSLEAIPPPENDDFAGATSIGALPFSNTQDLTGATLEAGEPAPACFSTSNTVWYSFTAGTTQSIMATVDEYGVGIAAYTGSSLSALSSVGCSQLYWQPLTFRAEAGTTYYFQVGAWCCGGFGPVTFRLQVAPNPVAQFSFYPSDPSSFDTIQFNDNSYDPAGVGISSEAWQFGDGATSSGCCPTHRYAADGDYTVKLTVTTPDGRTASTSQIVQVRTHDVSIIRLGVPKTAPVGQTIAINVYVQNTHYPETVQVDLDKSIPGGFSQVGSLTQSVLVKPGGQSTRFAFTYTVTSDDKAMGKITFRADATIIGHRDALPADNELLSTPVNVA
jgi:PKD repeat protein